MAHDHAWYEAHREEAKAYMRTYRQTDRGYAQLRASGNLCDAKQRGAPIDPTFTAAILARIFLDSLSCANCGVELPNLRDRKIDHKIPIFLGGEHSESNIQILCKPCDRRKSNAEIALANHNSYRETLASRSGKH